jgi:DNA gyrase/topoisomerase IV subunit A
MLLEPGQSVLAESVPYSACESELERPTMVNLLPLDEDERITSILPIDGYDDNQFVLWRRQTVRLRKTAATQFSRQRSVGLEEPLN